MNKVKYSNWWLLFGVIVLTILPLVFLREAEFNGTDSEASKVIKEIQPNYQPWFSSVLTPPSKEVESLLFASQAAIGAGVIGFVIGFYKGRSQK